MTSLMLSLRSVRKIYSSPSGDDVEVLRSVSLDVKTGESIAIVGPSGSGKSTLLNIIGTLDCATSGTVLLEGEDISSFTEAGKAEIRNRKIGFVFQQHHLLPQCSALENVLIPVLVSRITNSAEERARELLSLVGLGARLNYRPAQLSGGEQLRVAVVRSLINNPRVLLADEPTGSLDRTGASQLADLLVQINKEQKQTLIVVTHSLPVASKMDRTFTLIDGTLVEGVV